MAENHCKKQSKTPLENPTVTSHSRTISTIPPRKNNITFMPKFLVKLLRKKKQTHTRSISIDNSIDFGIGKTEKLEKISNGNKPNYLLQFIQNSKRVSSITSHKSRNQIPPVCASPSGSGSGSGMENRRKVNREKSGEMKEKKGVLKIKSLMKMKTREKEDKELELCKKKILMGEKCRPINGSLRYDKNGVIVPQDLPG